MKVAIVHECLTSYAGSERTIEAVAELFPDAPIYAIVYQKEALKDTLFAKRKVRTSFINQLPFAQTKHRVFLPLMPLAVEQHDLSEFDLIITSSHMVAKGVLTRADQLHISYIYTPARYAWDLYFQYLSASGGVGRMAIRLMMHYLRMWDVLSADRVDVFIASSRNIARRIQKTYRRPSRLIYPPVDVERFGPDQPRDDFFLTVARLVPYKKIDMIVHAFNQMKRPLVVIGEGPMGKTLKRIAGPTIQLLGYQSDDVVRDHMQRCRGFVFAAEEDFGISPLEAQAAGAPVIAYGKGGAAETIIDGQTGVLYPHQTVDSLVAGVARFESQAHQFTSAANRANAMRFSKQRFQREIKEMIDDEWRKFSVAE